MAFMRSPVTLASSACESRMKHAVVLLLCLWSSLPHGKFLNTSYVLIFSVFLSWELWAFCKEMFICFIKFGFIDLLLNFYLVSSSLNGLLEFSNPASVGHLVMCNVALRSINVFPFVFVFCVVYIYHRNWFIFKFLISFFSLSNH